PPVVARWRQRTSKMVPRGSGSDRPDVFDWRGATRSDSEEDWSVAAGHGFWGVGVGSWEGGVAPLPLPPPHAIKDPPSAKAAMSGRQSKSCKPSLQRRI